MGLKIKSFAEPMILSSKEESGNDLDLKDEFSDHKESEDEKNLLSDDSEADLSSEESIHSSDDDLNATNTEHKLLDNPAWADAMSKILKSSKPKRKKGIVLARAKKLNDTKKVAPIEEKLSFEIIKNEESEDIKTEPEIKQEKDIKAEKPDPVLSLSVAQRRLLKKVWQSKGRVKPSVLEKDREKALSKIATRGVITLFNAVRQQQKTLSEKLSDARGLEVKRDKAFKSINKQDFLDTLAENAKCENVDNPVKSESESDNEISSKQTATQNKTGKTWDVLRNNFMMGASMKDWDKDEEVEESKEKKKTKVKTSDKESKKSGIGGAKFSFSMDMDGDYEDEESMEEGEGGSEEEDDGSDAGDDDMDDASSDFSD